MLDRLDKKFADIGFKKIDDDGHGATYERYNEEYKFTQVLSIVFKTDGRHRVFSYDKELFDTKGIGNTCVGLTYPELKLATKKLKMKQREFKRGMKRNA